MLDIIVTIIGWAAKLLIGYTTITSFLCLLPRKKYPIVQPKTRFAVLIPARNEQNVVGALIKSLQEQDYPKELFDILVIPNNCTDDTENAAISAGAKVIHCTEPVSTKGEVLHQILEKLSGQYDAYCVFDADNIVDSQFLARMNDAIAAGAKVAKSRQCALNPYDNWVSGGYDLYFQSINLLHSKARMPFALSAKLIGTGFMVTDAILQKLNGWNTVTLTEDIEFAVQCAQIGEKVYFVPDALTYDEEPLSFAVSMRQRRRWSAGVQSVANRYTGRLLWMKPCWLRLDLVVHINMIYAQLLALIPVVYGMLGMPIAQLFSNLLITAAGFWLGGMAMGLALSVTAGRDPLQQWKAIVMYPAYIASWYPLHLWALFSKPKNWKPIVHGTALNR
jgi:cellulose synthase/poly-beta-1,6-N-acetylglucosamine synthase-like glycosyltransferase